MIIHGKVYSTNEPQEIEITGSSVFIASNIQSYTKSVDGYEVTGYEYDCTEYTKDEFLLQQSNKMAQLSQELAAAKILLGVD